MISLFFFWCWGLVELRASGLLGSHSTTWVIPPALFALGLFEIVSFFTLWQALTAK
jgi:hypothetical protein